MNEDLREFISLQRALVGRHSLVRELGRGGMGIVFLAHDVALDRPVAIKLLPPALAGDGRYRTQFLREARLAAGLAHPNIVPIHSVEEQGDLVWFVMGWVDGESLGARVRRSGPLPVPEAVQVVRQVAMALAHAHARGVVHRDVKPDNILIERDTARALVTDFGIARAARDGADDAVRAGTPHYLSPEQAAGAEGDAASDLYALGVTAWFALTGRHPHEAETVAGLLVGKVQRPAPALASVREGLSPRLSAAIDRALARDPAARWPDLERFAVELGEATSAAPAPPVVRAFTRTAHTLGRDALLSATVAASSVGVMVVLSAGGNLIQSIFAQAVMIPMAIVAGSFGLIRAAQVALAAMDVVRQGYGHPDVARAVEQEIRERELEVDARPRTQRVRDAWYYGSLGAAKSALSVWVASTSLPAWITLPAAAAASLVPALTLVKVLDLLRPGVGRWPRWLQGRPGRAFYRLVERFTGRPAAHQLPATPTVVALGGAIDELYASLAEPERTAMGDLPRLAGELQREATELRARPRSEATDARLALLVTALETLRLELLSLRAGLRTVPDITAALEQARRLEARVDGAIGPLPVTGG